jgi:hypothetical protein
MLVGVMDVGSGLAERHDERCARGVPGEFRS